MTDLTNIKYLLRVKSRVYNALILRYVITKYGRGDLGFLWVVIEPMILCVGVIIIWSILKGSKEHGLNLASVVFTGYMPLTLWRHMSNSTGYILRYSRSIVHFQDIGYFDIVLSRLFLEFISVTASFLVVYIILYQLDILPLIYDISLVVQGWLIMAGLGFGGGILIAAATESSNLTEKFIPPLQYLMLPLSGCFFMLDWLPDTTRDAVSWVPFVHAFETIRSGFFGPTVTTYACSAYAFFWIIFLSACGLYWLERVQYQVEP